jgi:O-methyltransferase
VNRFEKTIDALARRVGVQVSRVGTTAPLPVEATAEDTRLIDSLRPYTMTSPQRLWSLINAVNYVVGDRVPGDFAECGVWRGGSVMAMAQQLNRLNASDRRIWLYDTYEGMTDPTEKDVEAGSGVRAVDMLDSTPVADGNNVWCVASIEDVRANVLSTEYPAERFEFVKGDVAETLLTSVPDQLSLLRLDTDWYESTRLGLEVLYPRLSLGGVCILDDYGHWEGARVAVDEYFGDWRPLMHQIDYSGRIFIKTR